MKVTGEGKPASSFTVIQVIKTSWGKSSRAGSATVQRNAVPEVLRVPLLEHPGDEAVFEHRVSFDGHQKISVPTEETETLHPKNPLRVKGIVYSRTQNGTEITYQHDPYWVGAPVRSAYARVFLVKPDGWLQIRYNGRFSNHGFWSYQKVIINVAVLTSVNVGIFFDTQPSKSFSDLASLR